jgi:hypothetical protein
MKYSHIIYTGLLSGGLLLTSCDEELELQPQQTLSADAAFADELTSQGSLIGVYSKAQDLEVYGSMPQVIADYQSDNVNFIGSFPTLQEINDFSTLSDNGSISTLWADNYETILAANAVIANVPEVDDPGFTAEEKAQFVAEAKFLRALVNFQMVNLFADPINVEGAGAPGIPIVNDPFTGEVELPARATVGEVHTQIQQDLQEGITALPETNLGRATRGAAQALLSRLHLYRGEYQQAADLARTVINDGVYQLAPNYSFYSQNTNEEIFSLQNSATDNGRTGSGGWASYYSPAESGGRGDAPFSQDLLDAYAEEPGDLRFSTLIEYSPDSSLIFTDKFSDATTNADNVPIIRITEMYLNLAEALAELNGINQESVDLINELRTRAGLPAWTVGQFGSQEEFIDAILVERRKELAFEGHRRMDLLRKGKPLRSTGPTAGVSNPGDPKTIMPIPQREMDLNSNLVQNEGY